MDSTEFVEDKNGRPVKIGSVVKVVSLDKADFGHLDASEFERVYAAFVGRAFEVYEIDRYGQAWVEREAEVAPGQYESNGVALAQHEMELQE